MKLNRNWVKDSMGTHTCGRIRPGETGFKYCTVPNQRRKGEKQQIFQLRPCCFTVALLLSSALLYLLEGITRDWYIPVSWLGKRETGLLCVWWDKEEGKVWSRVFWSSWVETNRCKHSGTRAAVWRHSLGESGLHYQHYLQRKNPA